MNVVWIISTVLQWLVIAALCILVLALVRQIGVLTLRLNSLGKDADGDGPALYTLLRRHTIPLLTGGAFDLGGDRDQPSLVVFFTPGCGTCAGMDAELRKFADEYPPDELSLLVVMVGDKKDAANYLAHETLDGIAVAAREDFPDQYLPMGRMPYAFAITIGGVVAARGRPRTVKAFIEMAHAARFMADTATDDIVRQHEWGETAPYWALKGGPEAGVRSQAEITDQRTHSDGKERILK